MSDRKVPGRPILSVDARGRTHLPEPSSVARATIKTSTQVTLTTPVHLPSTSIGAKLRGPHVIGAGPTGAGPGVPRAHSGSHLVAGAFPRLSPLQLCALARSYAEERQGWSNFTVMDPSTSPERGDGVFDKVYYPTTACEVASAIREAEADGKTIRAVGSGFSSSSAPIPQTQPLPPTSYREIWSDSDYQHFGRVIRPDNLNKSMCHLLPSLITDTDGMEFLFLVEAGIMLRELILLLDRSSPRMTLPTMGGETGQTLAGAFSTGTHGADFDRAPLADAIQAIYLIGQGGQHWWIEPTVHITNEESVTRTFPPIHRDRVKYHDDLFNAVLVSMGCMGVIYAVILKAVPQYTLRRVNRNLLWDELVDIAGWNFGSGRPSREELLAGPAFTGAITGIDSQLEEGGSVRFLQVVINPIADRVQTAIYQRPRRQCWITNHAEVPMKLGTETVGTGPLLSLLTIDYVKTLLHDTGIEANDSTWGFYEWIQSGIPPFPIPLQNTIHAICASLSPDEAQSLASQIATIVTVAEDAIALGDQTHATRPWMVEKLLSAAFNFNFPSAPWEDLGYRVMTGGGITSGDRLGNIRGLGLFVEITFDFVDAINFMPELLSIFDDFAAAAYPGWTSRVYPFAWISLRVSGPTRATMGMQRFPLSASIELVMLRGFDPGRETQHRRAREYLIQEIERRALDRGGILHWGQANHLMNETHVERAFGVDAVERFKNAQLLFSGFTEPRTFRSLFTDRCGLSVRRHRR